VVGGSVVLEWAGDEFCIESELFAVVPEVLEHGYCFGLVGEGD